MVLAMDIRDWLNNDYYHIFGINQTSTQDEINKAYRKKAKQTHPDMYPMGSIQRDIAEHQFKKLLEIKDTLTDPEKREVYDKERLVSQECYLSFVSTGYSLPVNPENKENTTNSFKNKLKDAIKNNENSTYKFSEEDNSFHAEDSDFELNDEQKGSLEKHEKARYFYNLGVMALRYGAQTQAITYFRSAKMLDPKLKMPMSYYMNYNRRT